MKKINKILIILSISFIMMGGFLLPNLAQAVSAVSYPTPAKDSDFDGLTDQGEIQKFKTNPLIADTDGDGYLDGAEILSGTDPLDSNSPAKTFKEERVNEIISTTIETQKSPWPWYFSRASGVTGYLLLFLLIVSGIGIKTSATYRLLSPTTAWITHRYIGIALAFTVFAHLTSLLFDEFLKFTLWELLVPFASNFAPLYVALGIIGFYLFLGIIITSLFFMQKAPKLWRALHYFTYPVFLLIFLHGILTGTDTSSSLMQNVYWSTGIIVAIMLSYRLFISYKLNKK